jgi:hypothetical protein
MQSSPVATRSFDWSRGQSVGHLASIVAAAVVVAVLTVWIVAASLGLGADPHPGIGPDRPPAPDLIRVLALLPDRSAGSPR